MEYIKKIILIIIFFLIFIPLFATGQFEIEEEINDNYKVIIEQKEKYINFNSIFIKQYGESFLSIIIRLETNDFMKVYIKKSTFLVLNVGDEIIITRMIKLKDIGWIVIDKRMNESIKKKENNIKREKIRNKHQIPLHAWIVIAIVILGTTVGTILNCMYISGRFIKHEKQTTNEKDKENAKIVYTKQKKEKKMSPRKIKIKIRWFWLAITTMFIYLIIKRREK